MRYLTLIYKQDQETGEMGFSLKNMKDIEYPSVASEGLLIAHDVLEHQQGIEKIGTIGDELIALGGIWYCRGEWGDLRRDNVGSMHTPHSNLASDVVNMGRMVCVNGNNLYAKHNNEYNRSSIQYDIDEIIMHARNDLPVEMDGEEFQQSCLDEYLENAKHLIAKGYVLAERRFKKDQAGANSMFWNIAEAVDNALRWAEFEGQEFRLGYERNQATCYEIPFNEEY